jgi:hypothetical protein
MAKKKKRRRRERNKINEEWSRKMITKKSKNRKLKIRTGREVFSLKSWP